ncbi:hypothetical protein NDU88_000965 [Pleurodeles waltl]|uniref:Apolipoprotein D n=1 Tax=Pleurodeles waltl TaxID=8319 RepID=A0AAV7L9Y2_PLEWA|nr:hypothetical protein NDU88_000965 [Pleurodeles waltl]
MLELFVVLLILSSAEGGGLFDFERLIYGNCTEPPVQENFNINKFLGKWYEIEKTPEMSLERRCNQATYSFNSEGKITVLYQDILSNGRQRNFQCDAYWTKGSDPAKMKMKIKYYWLLHSAPLWVLSTDYEHYALIYSCYQLFYWHVDYTWILSRERQLDQGTVTKLKEILTSNGIDTAKMISSDQSMCPEDF